MNKELESLKSVNIKFKDWGNVYKCAKAIGVNTFAELEMYCSVRNIHNEIELRIQLCNDYLEYLYTKGV